MTEAEPIDFDQLPANNVVRRLNGNEHGSNLSCFIIHSPPGTGPVLHRHPYEETLIIEEGTARFTAGDREFEASGGPIVVLPAGTPHKFVNTGPGRLHQVDIHPVARIIHEDLE